MALLLVKGKVWHTYQKGKKVRRPLTTQKAVAIHFRKKSHPLEKTVVVIQWVHCGQSSIWGQKGFCSRPSYTAVATALEDSGIDLPASVRTNVFLDVCLLEILKLQEMEIITHP